MDKVLVDIIIPIYQPQKGWEVPIREAIAHLHNHMSDLFLFHLILVNDGKDKLSFSWNKMPEGVTYYMVDYEGNKGKGYAVRKGIESATGKYLIFTDHDIPYGWKAIRDVILALENGIAVVIPKRTSHYYSSLSLKRRYISRLLIMTNSILFRLNHPDTQAGLKGINSRHKEIILSGKEDGFLFEVEWIRKAEKEKLSIGAIPISLVEGKQLSSVGNTTIFQLGIAYLRLFFRH